MKKIKIVATRCHILRLNAPNLISAGAPSQTPLGGAYHAPPDHLAGLRGPTSKDREGREGREGEEKGKGRTGREWEGGEESWYPTFWMKVTPLVIGILRNDSFWVPQRRPVVLWCCDFGRAPVGGYRPHRMLRFA